MKKYISFLSLLFIFFAFFCFAAEVGKIGGKDVGDIGNITTKPYEDVGKVGGVQGGGGTVNYCTGTNTCNTPPTQCDQLCEDMMGSSNCDATPTDSICRNTWVRDIGIGQTGDWTTTISGTTPCPNTINTNGVLTLATTTNGKKARVYYSSLTKGKNNYVQYYMNVVSTSLGDTEADPIYAGCSDTSFSGRAFMVGIKMVGSDLKTNLWYSKTTWSDTELTATSGTTIVPGTWYRVNVQQEFVLNTSCAIKVYINGVEQTDLSITDCKKNDSSYTTTYPHFGLTFSTRAYNIQIMNIAIDDDTVPGACQ